MNDDSYQGGTLTERLAAQDDRRTVIVRQDSGTHPDMHHVYLDLDTGAWGDRSSLVIVSLTDSQLAEFADQTDAERRGTWEGCNRYFGTTYGAGIRRHLSQQDRPAD